MNYKKYKNIEKFYVDDVSFLKQLQNIELGCRSTKLHGKKMSVLLKKNLPKSFRDKIKYYKNFINISFPDKFIEELNNIYIDKEYWPKSKYDTTILNLAVEGHYIGGIIQNIGDDEYNLYFIGDIEQSLLDNIQKKSYRKLLLKFIKDNKIILNLIPSKQLFQLLDPVGRCLDMGILTGYMLSIYLTKFKKIIKNNTELFRARKRLMRQLTDKLIVYNNITTKNVTKKEKIEIINEYIAGLTTVKYTFDYSARAKNKQIIDRYIKNIGLFKYLKYLFIIDLISFIITKKDINFYDDIRVFDKEGISINLKYKGKISILKPSKIRSLKSSTPMSQKNYDLITTEDIVTELINKSSKKTI